MSDQKKLYKLTKKWLTRLEGVEGVEKINWANTSRITYSVDGIKLANKLVRNVTRNKDALEALAGREDITEEDKIILRSFYRQYQRIATELREIISSIDYALAVASEANGDYYAE